MNSTDKRPIILIVDDMATNIAVLYDLLRDEYRIKAAKSGFEALEIARGKEKPDLILLDIEMPGMDGYEVCKALKSSEETNHIPIIFVTAKSGIKDEEYGLNLGALDYIAKPFHPTIVKIRVRNHIALKLKSDLLEELSMYDGLTHIPNRRFFEEVYEKYYKKSLREGRSMGVLMIDVDHFKNYNDYYGHGKGDECLVKIAETLKNTLKRPGDIVARYVGEDFVILLYDVDADGVKTVAHNLVDSVAQLNIVHEFSSAARQVTISVGAALSKGVEEGKKELLERADEALYRSKQNGRNRCAC